MTIAKAIKMLENEYEKARENSYVNNPLAYSLYKVWKIADSEPVPNVTPNTKRALAAIGKASHSEIDFDYEAEDGR